MADRPAWRVDRSPVCWCVIAAWQVQACLFILQALCLLVCQHMLSQ